MGKIKGVLKDNNKSIKDAANALGVHRETINYWDKKSGVITVSDFQKLADFLGVSFNDLKDRIYG